MLDKTSNRQSHNNSAKLSDHCSVLMSLDEIPSSKVEAAKTTDARGATRHGSVLMSLENTSRMGSNQASTKSLPTKLRTSSSVSVLSTKSTRSLTSAKSSEAATTLTNKGRYPKRDIVKPKSANIVDKNLNSINGLGSFLLGPVGKQQNQRKSLKATGRSTLMSGGGLSGFLFESTQAPTTKSSTENIASSLPSRKKLMTKRTMDKANHPSPRLKLKKRERSNKNKNNARTTAECKTVSFLESDVVSDSVHATKSKRHNEE